MDKSATQRVLLVDSAAYAGKTLERFLLEDAGLLPRSRLKKALVAGEVFVNGARAKRTQEIRIGDEVRITDTGLYTVGEGTVAPNPSLPLDVLLETPSLLVVNKPSGQNSHPLHPSERDTCLNALVARFPETASAREAADGGPHPLEGLLAHRLDRGTSGVLICARSAAGLDALKRAWKTPGAEKVYLAWVHGELTRAGRLELALGHDPKSRKRMIPAPGDASARMARTSLLPLRTARVGREATTLVLARIHTGVMHQIRATVAALGNPVLGDEIYVRAGTTKRWGPDAGPPAFSDLDRESRAVLERLAHGLPEKLVAPGPAGDRSPFHLPESGFLLHALWLRIPEIEGLEDGVLAPVPESF